MEFESTIVPRLLKSPVIAMNSRIASKTGQACSRELGIGSILHCGQFAVDSCCFAVCRPVTDLRAGQMLCRSDLLVISLVMGIIRSKGNGPLSHLSVGAHEPNFIGIS